MLMSDMTTTTEISINSSIIDSRFAKFTVHPIHLMRFGGSRRLSALL